MKIVVSSAWKKDFTKSYSVNAESIMHFYSHIARKPYEQTTITNCKIHVRIVAFCKRFHDDRLIIQVSQNIVSISQFESFHAIFF